MGRLTIRLLGAPQVRHADADVSFPTRKTLALLTYLAVESGPHAREKLTALFWPDSDPGRGRAALRYTLAALRRALGEAAESAHLRIARDSVSFASESELELDVLDLDEVTGDDRSLVSAAALWRGEFLEGFSLSDAPEFDEWTSFQRERWHGRAEHIFEGLARAQADSGARADAADTVGRWIAMSPLSETAHRQLIELHLAAGEPAAALRVYETFRNMLNRELGTAPDPRTQALLERIRGTALTDEPPISRQDPTELVEGPLVGRSNEFSRLVESYHGARQGSGRVAVVRGEPVLARRGSRVSLLHGPRVVVLTCSTAAPSKLADASRTSLSSTLSGHALSWRTLRRTCSRTCGSRS
jgi:DNA-binding SARP family transcriptional activator